jgi:hypothetical protein
MPFPYFINGSISWGSECIRLASPPIDRGHRVEVGGDVRSSDEHRLDAVLEQFVVEGALALLAGADDDGVDLQQVRGLLAAGTW